MPDTGDNMLISRASFSVDSAEQWTATLFADNFNNWQGILVKQFGNNPLYFPRVRPRTVGVQLEYRCK